ncbi:MAG: iron ABC transporter permease [Oscillospiraceae bacterium]|nr:iron ABC transporter permease [Oscillospiraceae bacterium]
MVNKTGSKTLFLICAAFISVILGIGIGSVFIPPKDILAVLASSLTGAGDSAVDPIVKSLVTDIRLPRVLLAFLTGAALSVGGTVMQSVLKNPLASPFSLGVSAGAGLGAAIVIVSGATVGLLGTFLLPAVSFSFGLITVILVIGAVSKIDRRMSNVTIVLTGMVVSLFFSAIMDLLATVSPTYAQRINLWQMGSFSAKEWSSVWILLPILLICIFVFMRYAKEMDIMTFGEEQAQAMGVNLKRSKWILICFVAVLTGTAVAFAGIIGFVDLIAPHIVRRFFGSSHRKVLPASALFGGTFMVLCDLAARTLTSPKEIPIGAITALIGAPFFIYIFFAKRKR